MPLILMQGQLLSCPSSRFYSLTSVMPEDWLLESNASVVPSRLGTTLICMQGDLHVFYRLWLSHQCCVWKVRHNIDLHCQMRLLCQVLRDNFDFMQENIQTVWFRIFCFRASVVPKVLSTTWIFKVKWVSCAEPFWHDTDLYAERSSKLPDCWFSFSYWFPPKELNTTLTFKAQWVCCVEPLRHDTDFYANIQSRLPDCRFSLPF